jgi:hypothetical protein
MLTSKYEEKICNIYLIHDKFFSVGYNFFCCYVTYVLRASGLEVVTVLVWGAVLLVSFPP